MPVVGSPQTRQVADVVEEARRYLEGSSTSRLIVLDGTVDPDATSLTFEDSLTGISEGTLIELGLEQMYVRSADEATKTVTVLRGHGGTPATTHVDGAICHVAPSYQAWDIFNAVLDEYAALNGTGLVQHWVVEFSFNGTDDVYDLGLPTDRVSPLYVQESVTEVSASVSKWRPATVKLVRSLDGDDFPSGFGLQVVGIGRSIERGSRFTGSRLSIVRSTVATTFDIPNRSLLSEVTDDALGINENVAPIVAVGAAWRLMLGKEGQRTNPDVSHGSRRGEEVQPGALTFLGRSLKTMKDDLVRGALERQYAEFPPRQNL